MASEEQHTHKLGTTNKWVLGSSLLTSGIIVAPYIEEILKGGVIQQLMASCGQAAGVGFGGGFAGTVNNFIGSIPVVGSSLAAGGWATALTSGGIGIGGILLGNYIHKKYDKEGGVPWGKVIKYCCLATSALIALPSLLTAISIGVTYIAASLTGLFNPQATAGVYTSVSSFMANSVGVSSISNNITAGGAGIASILSHAFTCGGAALSLAGAALLSGDEAKHEHAYEHKKKGGHHHHEGSGLKIELANYSIIANNGQRKLAFCLKDGAGNILSDVDLRETHTKKLHVMIIDDSLTDYHHLHPKYDSKTGLFATSFIPKKQNGYSVWHDFELKNGEHYILKKTLPATRNYDVSPTIQHSNHASAEGINISVEANPPLGIGKNSMVQIRVVDDSNKPIKLEPVLGASAHLVGFSKGGEHFIHCHPLGGNAMEGELNFHIAPSQDGFTKFFLQIKTEGREVVIPFGQYIKPHAKLSERENLATTNQYSTVGMMRSSYKHSF
ncbi:MAG: hypothetical protein ABL857_02595 [Rickettsiales bacterium]|jgi:hypothetical protein